MMQQLRQAVRASIAPYLTEIPRVPALRRCRDMSALLACDGVSVMSPQVFAAWKMSLEVDGWTVQEAHGWVHLDPPWECVADEVKVAGLHLTWDSIPHGEAYMDLFAAFTLLSVHGAAGEPLSPTDKSLLRSIYHASKMDGHTWCKAWAGLHRHLAVCIRQGTAISARLQVLLVALLQEMGI